MQMDFFTAGLLRAFTMLMEIPSLIQKGYPGHFTNVWPSYPKYDLMGVMFMDFTLGYDAPNFFDRF